MKSTVNNEKKILNLDLQSIILNLLVFLSLSVSLNLNAQVNTKQINNTTDNIAPILSTAIANRMDLFKTTNNPVEGTDQNTIVLFYDYNCEYSRDLYSKLESELAKNSYRVIYRPIDMVTGVEGTSRDAAELALSVYKNNPSSFKAVHKMLMTNKTGKIVLTADDIDSVKNQLKKLLNDDKMYNQIQSDITNGVVREYILENRVVYDRIRFPGVPSIIAARVDQQSNIQDNKIFYIAGSNSKPLEDKLYLLRR